MKYYLMCKKLLGQKQFDELVANLTSQIIVKFTSEIFLDQYMEVLEYNIKVLMIISLSNVLNLSENEKIEKINLKELKKFLVVEDVLKFKEVNQKYINKITKLLS